MPMVSTVPNSRHSMEKPTRTAHKRIAHENFLRPRARKLLFG